jgi:ATP-binding cassette, subfamily B, bacterial PglK
MRNAIRQVFQIVDKTAKRWLIIIIILTLISSALEALGISLIFPLLKLITEPEIIKTHETLSWIYEALGLTSSGQFIILTSVAFFAVFLFKNIYMAGFYFIQYTFAFTGTVRLTERLLHLYFDAPYAVLLARNSAELIRNVREATHDVYSTFLVSFINLIVEAFLILAVATIVFLIEPMATIIAGGLIIALISGYYVVCGPLFERWGHERLALSRSALQTLQQSLGSIKESRVLGRTDFFLRRFKDIQLKEISNRRNHQMSSQLPRLINETIMLGAMLAVVVVVFLSNVAVSDVIAALGVFAAAALRLMPSVNRITVALNSLRGSMPAVATVHSELAEFSAYQPPSSAIYDKDTPPRTIRSIRLEKLCFSYPGSDIPALRDIDAEIHAGESIGLVGASGAGKTTLADIILGLLSATSGELVVNGCEANVETAIQHQKIGYVPQSIFILDDTVRNNIAFGIDPEKIDDAQVHAALKLAHLDQLVEQLPDGISTELNEHGARLSGGQRQRVGIARALYDDPNILVFDEATSALDGETEYEITRAIQELKVNKTIIVIAHRLSTVRSCDRLFFLDEGRLVDSGSFDELRKRNDRFNRLAEISGISLPQPSGA